MKSDGLINNDAELERLRKTAERTQQKLKAKPAMIDDRLAEKIYQARDRSPVVKFAAGIRAMMVGSLK